MKLKLNLKASVAIVMVGMAAFTACKKNEQPKQNLQVLADSKKTMALANLPKITVDFEVGSKSPKQSYDLAPAKSTGGDDATINGNPWNLFDALIGNLSTDKKNGSWSLRIRNTGKATMLYDIPAEVNTVSIKHATFGTDGGSKWGLWYSLDGGNSWIQSGSNVSSTTSLQTQNFTLTAAEKVRLEIRKLSGGSDRINIDDIMINGGGKDQIVNPTPDPEPTPTNPGTSAKGKKFLFDATKLENAGSADWLIDADGTESVPTFSGGPSKESKAQRYPTPSYTQITASTQENFWKGGISAWAVELVKRGQMVETLPNGTAITYGDSSNPQDLSNYDVYVVAEPNKLFSSSEKKAIMNFVSNGGGLMMIADHSTNGNGGNPSDRDGDGNDSPRVWNDLMTNNGINDNNPFGFNVDYVDFSEKPSSKVYTGSNANAQAVLKGAAGTASKLSFYNGTSATLSPSQNANVQGLFWKSSASIGSNNGVMALLSTYGSGRIVFIGDSSPADDGTGDTGDKLYDGWAGDQPSGYTSHPALHLNASLWLAKAQ